ITILFLGGWLGPLLPGIVWFILKVFVLIFIMMWIRFTFPRFRVDQLMGFGWKILVPLSLLNVMITASVVMLFG
ncbi:MAG: NADH-quinone oxidoreductase subunit H, partial [Proteobacteria bacterium]|nr:NADH-quinone oxidoreductase subunit H [Pseudomonadota bacterium]